MLSKFVLAAFAATASAYTPPGLEPSSSANLTVAFGSTLAVNGKDIVKSETTNAPTVGTVSKLSGAYAILMVDFDIPPMSNSTNQRLHWLQTGLTSADSTTTVAGVQVYELINPGNTSALAVYNMPNPPARAPLSHRYVQFLLNLTDNIGAVAILQQYSQSRTNFSAVDVLNAAGLTVIAGNWFNVTNTSTIATTTTGVSSTGTGAPISSTGGAGSLGNGGSLVAGLGVFAAAMAML